MKHSTKLVRIIPIICLVLGLIVSSSADCNLCKADSDTACVSKTEFQLCTDNKPSGDIYKCSEGQFCSVLGLCSDNSDLADCDGCLKCDESKTFACTGTKEFKLCLGTTNISEIVGHCSGDLVCNVNYRQICVESAATCSIRDDSTTTTIATTTTPSPPDDPAGFCAAIKKEGRYPVGSNAATTCHQYIHCLLVKDVWYGPIYNCPGSTYYDSAQRICVSQLPSLCNSTVSTLSFRNILLA